MIIDCALYMDGQRVPEPVTDLSDAVDLAEASANGFVWIGLFEPTEAEFAEVRAEFNLHELAVEDAVKAHQRPKIDLYDGMVFLVLKTIRYLDRTELIETGEIAVFLGEHYILSVRHGEGSPLNDVRLRLEASGLLKYGPGAALHAICDKDVDNYLEVCDDLQEDIDDIEEQVFGDNRTADAGRIYNLKREVLEAKRGVLPLNNPLQKIVAGAVPMIHDECRTFFKDVLDHNLRAGEVVESFDSLLTSVLDANLAQVSVQQNEDMRRISAWVAIAAAPTMLAGIWGMNFNHMPELRWRLGYPMALAIIGGTMLLLYRLFKRSGWL